jgi:hypothetical protein
MNDILLIGKPRRLAKSPDHVERQRTYPVQDFTDRIGGIFYTWTTAS